MRQISRVAGESGVDALAGAGRDRGRRLDILEHGKAVGCFRHDREMEAALGAWLRKPRLLLVQIVGLVLRVSATRADSDEPRALQLEIHDYVLHDRAGADSPLLSVLVVGIHVPIFERFEAGPETNLIVPRRVVRVRPPGEMQETGQGLEVMSHAREDELELLVIAGSPESNALHALIDCHDHSPDSRAPMGSDEMSPSDVPLLLRITGIRLAFYADFDLHA